MLTISTALSALSCVLTSVLYYLNGFPGDQFLERVFERSAEEAEKQAESSHLRGSCICKCGAVDPTPLLVEGVALGFCILFVGIWLGRRRPGRVASRTSEQAPAPTVSHPLALEDEESRPKRRVVRPSTRGA